MFLRHHQLFVCLLSVFYLSQIKNGADSASFHTCEGCKERARPSTNRGLNLLVLQGALYLHFLCDNYSDSRAKKKEKM